MYSVISVKMDSLPGNTKNRESTRLWLIRVQFVHPWAAKSTLNGGTPAARARTAWAQHGVSHGMCSPRVRLQLELAIASYLKTPFFPHARKGNAWTH